MKKVLVLMGGPSPERDVSLATGKNILSALQLSGVFDVSALDWTGDIKQLIDAIDDIAPDCVFNALHGEFGEDGRVQALLDLLKIPYTHSGVTASAVCMDKQIAKDILSAHGVRAPVGMVASMADIKRMNSPRPLVIKPLNGGSSVGTFIIKDADVWPDIDDAQVMLCESFVSGREFTVAVLNNQPLGVTEIIPRPNTFYDYENKYSANGARHVCPAQLSPTQTKAIMDIAKLAFEKLGCRGLARADFIYDGDVFYFLEMNTQPGMTEFSLAPEQAAACGMPFVDLVKILINTAMGQE